MKESWKNLCLQITMNEELRLKKEQKLRKEEGNRERVDWLYGLDLQILRSGLRQKIPFLNAEILLFGMFLIMVGGFFLVKGLFQSTMFGIFTFIFLGICIKGMLHFLVVYQDRQIEGQMLNFMNLLENYSRTTEDILDIFGRIILYLEGRLKDVVEESYFVGMRTGSTQDAFTFLYEHTAHPKFQTFIRNMEICSRHDANYGEIIRDSRKTWQGYLHYEQEKKEIRNNGRVELLLILGSSSYILYMMNGFTQKPLLTGLLETTIGQGIIVYCGIILLCCFSFFCLPKKGGRQ